ncbi:ribonucleoside-diphosphate reductase large subunit isoform X2 [Cephus cinctus]|nr:ribonucleoside-diphosphate reductase large subunit isoform X2 [Cephus cinctus]
MELDNLAVQTAAIMTMEHADYAILAARIAVSKLHKETKESFCDVMSDLHYGTNPDSKIFQPMISEKHHNIIKEHSAILNSVIVYDRDFDYNYFGFKTLEKSFLLKINGKVVERPQHMLMRVAISIHEDDIEKVIETYNLMSQRYFIHSPPTLFYACSPTQQMSSSYLLSMSDDSIDGIFETLTRCAMISSFDGELGLNIHCIRARGTRISGTNADSNGLIPMLRVYDASAQQVRQRHSRRLTANTIYLEPWHADIMDFLELKKNIGKAEYRAKHLSYALWVPDLFMKRVMADGIWSLMCPHECPGLFDSYGDTFEILFLKYEKEKRYKRQIPARNVWYAILKSQVETGLPCMLYKDHCNRKSNQQNLGTIRGGNFSADIIQYTDCDEIAVCNSASIAVNMFVNATDRTYDFEKLKDVTKTVTRNLNKLVDVNWYPETVSEAKKSHLRHRPIGIGIQGLADAFILMRYPFESEDAQKLNIQIFETLYYAALEASCEISQNEGPYSSYEGCSVHKGILQYDMWNVKPTELWDWTTLKKKIAKYGVRNSLLITSMPTTSTAQVLGNSESIEPYTSNVYTTRASSEEFQFINPYLLRDLTEKNLWNVEIKNKIIANNGSILNVQGIPEDLKNLYKTAWEIRQKIILKMAVDRGAFIDQSQSLNIYMEKPTTEKLTSMHFYGWEMGLKTGMYYLHTKPAANSIPLSSDKFLQTRISPPCGRNKGFESPL